MALALRKAALGKYLHPSSWIGFFFGTASRGDTSSPVVHKHDDFERASEVDLAGFEVETDAQGHHYAVRKEDLRNQEA